MSLEEDISAGLGRNTIMGISCRGMLTLGMSLRRSSLKASLLPKNTRLASLPNGVLWSSQLKYQAKRRNGEKSHTKHEAGQREMISARSYRDYFACI